MSSSSTDDNEESSVYDVGQDGKENILVTVFIKNRAFTFNSEHSYNWPISYFLKY